MAISQSLPPPNTLLETYKQAYMRVNRREPQCRYIGNHWFSVNGETVHRAALMDEVARLRNMAQRSHLNNGDKSMIQRLIARLRGM